MLMSRAPRSGAGSDGSHQPMPVLTTSGGVASESLMRSRQAPLAARHLEMHPGAVVEPHGARRLGVHGEPRVGRDLERPGLIAEPRVVIALFAVAGDEHERIGLCDVLRQAGSRFGGV